MKVCERCKEEITPATRHYKYKSKCKFCIALEKKEYEQKKENVCKRLYWHQCHSSKTRGHVPPAYTRDELCEWVHSNPKFDKLYHTWKMGGYKSDDAVSIDRLDNTKPYTFSNIELVTWKVNNRRANRDKKSGVYCSQKVEVYKYTLSGKIAGVYYSQADAERNTPNANQQNISAVCMGKLESHAGFRWFFEEQTGLKPLSKSRKYSTPIKQFTYPEGIFIKEYPDMYTLIQDTGFTRDAVALILQKRRKSHRGFYFTN